MEITCNIDKTDRTNRLVFGGLLLLAALFDFGRAFVALLGIILVVEGIIGWCGIPYLVAKFRELTANKG